MYAYLNDTTIDDVKHFDQDLDEKIRVKAYFLWENAGRPEGRDKEFWIEAEKLIVYQPTVYYHTLLKTPIVIDPTEQS